MMNEANDREDDEEQDAGRPRPVAWKAQIMTATMEQPLQHHRHHGGRGTGGEQSDGDGYVGAASHKRL